MKPEGLDEKDFIYLPPTDTWLIKNKRDMEKFVTKCADKIKMESSEIETNYMILLNVFIRIDERADYYQYFHSKNEIMHMSTEKEVALAAYWIVKYKPFRLKSISKEEDFYYNYKCTINEVIAAMLIISYLCEKIPKLKDYYTENKINTLVYDLLNRDISKEALIMYVESYIKEV